MLSLAAENAPASPPAGRHWRTEPGGLHFREGPPGGRHFRPEEPSPSAFAPLHSGLRPDQRLRLRMRLADLPWAAVGRPVSTGERVARIVAAVTVAVTLDGGGAPSIAAASAMSPVGSQTAAHETEHAFSADVDTPALQGGDGAAGLDLSMPPTAVTTPPTTIPPTTVAPAPPPAPPPTLAPQGFVRPVPGGITSSFGNRRHPVTRRAAHHDGIDMAARTGTPIVAVKAGTVTSAGWMSGYGLYTCIDHGGSMKTCYGHQSKILVKRGERVDAGERIGLAGNTGRSTGAHLHFEVRINGKPVNPAKYL